MNFNSTLISSLPLSQGPELEIPNALVPVATLPLPLLAVATAAGVDLRGIKGSALCSRIINQGASSGTSAATLCTFDKGIYTVRGNMGGMCFGGIVPSSASPFFAVVQMLAPTSAFAQSHAFLGIPAAGVVVSQDFMFQLNLPISGWSLRILAALNTGVGESTGMWANASIEQSV